MDVCLLWVLCILSGRGLCNELITRPKSYRLWRVVVCDLETSWMRSPWPTGGCHAKNKQPNSQRLIMYHAINAFGWMDVWLHAFSHSSRNGGEWSGSPHGRFIPKEEVLVTDCIERLNGSQNQSGRFRELTLSSGPQPTRDLPRIFRTQLSTNFYNRWENKN